MGLLVMAAKRHRWQLYEIEWLRKNIKSYSWKDIATAFNNAFGLNLSQSSVEHICLKNGIDHGRKSEKGFVKGEPNNYSQTLPVGSETVGSRGRVFVKIKDDFYGSGGKRYRNFVQKDRYIYEQHYGKLSKNDMIIHLDGDKTNCEIDNLYKVSRAINIQLAVNKWIFSDKNMTLTAIKLCELADLVR